MALYPIFIEARDRPVLIIGGGRVAAEKARGLIAAEAAITIVAPEITDDEIAALAAAGRITHVARAFEERDLDAPWAWVMVATDDGAINAAVRSAAQRRRLLVNAADDPAHCDFILPAVVRKGRITIAASTAGASPALARRLREELEAYLTEDMPALADLLADVRTDLRARGIRVESDRWQQAIDERLRVLLAQRKHHQARAHLLAGLGVDLPPTRALEDAADADEDDAIRAFEQQQAEATRGT